MKLLKRFFALFLSFVFCIHFPFLISVNAVETDNISSTQFLESTQKMISKYGVIEDSLTNSINNNTNRIVVKTNSNSKIDCLNAVEIVEGFNNLHILQFESSQDTQNALEYFSQQNYVEYVEEDLVFFENNKNSYKDEPTFDIVPSLDDYGCAMINSKATVSSLANNDNLPEIIVAVFDSGLAENHPFFNYSRILNDGKYLFSTNTNDEAGHGTHVAGIIYNNTPTNVKIRPYKVVNDYGQGLLLFIALGIYSAVNNGANIINISLGQISDALTYLTFADAVSYAKKNNVSVVVAAGNEFKKLTAETPAIVADCITVSSVNEFGQPSDFSNYGNMVDIAAPGEKINSALPYNNIMVESNKECNHHYYATISGTSMSTPFISAAIAILLSTDPVLSVSEIETILKQTAYVPDNWDTDYGAGIVDFSKMMTLTKTIVPQIKLTIDGAVINSTPQAKIYYTTDGSTPIVGESNLYLGGFIKTEGIETINAIAFVEGQTPSSVATLKIKWSENIDIRYKGRISVKSSYDIAKYNCSNEGIVSFDGKQIKGESIGEASVIIFYETGQRVTYNVTVDFAPFQWFHEIIYKLFGILLWSL